MLCCLYNVQLHCTVSATQLCRTQQSMDIRTDAQRYRDRHAKRNQQIMHITETKNDINNWMARLTISLPSIPLPPFPSYRLLSILPLIHLMAWECYIFLFYSGFNTVSFPAYATESRPTCNAKVNPHSVVVRTMKLPPTFSLDSPG